MIFNLEYRNNDYRFFSDSVEADTLEEAIKKAKGRLKDHQCFECTVLADVAYIDNVDADAEVNIKHIEQLYFEMCKEHAVS